MPCQDFASKLLKTNVRNFFTTREIRMLRRSATADSGGCSILPLGPEASLVQVSAMAVQKLSDVEGNGTHGSRPISALFCGSCNAIRKRGSVGFCRSPLEKYIQLAVPD